ncbi:hypothetical protein QFC21_002435 [Naganishia friedmannii]|uniref:Uncharacterized protein n=1 Tax=Naganishia friedmannii TaxID=89922 RepID=A0ACC2VXB4_9TREE|nr:hypothetical protein QFC21_002435 [Naganishia friedmannii]
MSQIPDAVHSYHPRPAEGGGTHVPFRISKRITATPPLITLFPPPPLPRNAPLGVRVALKTTYNLVVLSSLLPSLTTAAEQAQQAKTVVKHAQILRPESARMCIRVKCVVDGVECVVPAVEEAFTAGLQQANEIIPAHPFLPSFAKDETKPTCFLERIDVELVFKTDRGIAKKRKNIAVGEASQQDPMESQAGTSELLTVMDKGLPIDIEFPIRPG